MNFNTADKTNFSGKRVFVRVDYNVPVDESGNITDDRRIRATVPLLKTLVSQGAKIILGTHMGRPQGDKDQQLSLDGAAKHLGTLLGKTVTKLSSQIGPDVATKISAMKPGDVVMLENLRFHPAEKSKDKTEREAFAKELAKLADVYINEAFANCHRDHASMTSLPKLLPAYAGPSLTHELTTITKAIQSPLRPFVALLGGKKGDKLSVMKNLLGKVDHLLIAGALGFYFLQRKGVSVGEVKIDLEGVEFPMDLINHPKVVLPMDAIIGQKFADDAPAKAHDVGGIPAGWTPFDIGPKTIAAYSTLLSSAKTIIWAGPIGAYEAKPYAGGTKGILAAITKPGITTIVGGGDTGGSVEHFGFQNKITHISTGGGVSLQLFAGEELPAVKAIEESKKKFG